MSAPEIELICNLEMSGNRDELYAQILTNAQYADGTVFPADPVCRPEQYADQRVAICGAGPSLATEAHHIGGQYDQVWGCNRALNWLVAHDYPVTHGFAVDQGLGMLEPHEWRDSWDVTYLLASSVHPLLVKRLKRRGRRIQWFHNYLGMGNPEGWVDPPEWKAKHPGPMETGKEFWIYTTRWPSTVQVGYGLNAVPRAICLALFLGFRTIDVYGADCACLPDAPVMPSTMNPEYDDWLKQVWLYPEHTVYATYGPKAMMIEHHLGGHRWHTRPDMVISAKHLVDLIRGFDGKPRTELPSAPCPHIRLIGDTLPALMAQQPPDYLKGVPDLNGKGGIVGLQAHPELIAQVNQQFATEAS